MPRPPRIEFEGAVYHVMNRGDRREPIFHDEADRERFLETLVARQGWSEADLGRRRKRIPARSISRSGCVRRRR